MEFKKKQLNRLDAIIPRLYTNLFNFFDSTLNNIKLHDVHDYGLIKLIAVKVKENRLKLSSNRNLLSTATGICRDIIFQNENILLNKYYYFSGTFILVKHGIIYCDIIQEQIVCEDYRQVLQLITLESGQNSQKLLNNLDLHYVPVKIFFINNILIFY